MKKPQLILFTRFPEPGRVKTRLIPALGPEGACALHRKMTEWTLKTVQAFSTSHAVAVEIRFEGGSRLEMEKWLGSDFRFTPQVDGDLGIRLETVFPIIQ